MTLHRWNDKFDKDYFENGIKEKKSLYENYRWIPKLSLPMAHKLKEMYPNKSILDYGCAKGYLVHALRIIGVESYGYDVSKYAIENCHPKVSKFIFSPDKNIIPKDVIFAKDTLEHVEYKYVEKTISHIRKMCRRALIIVPFGENKKYRIPEYELDTTHIIRKNEEWWEKKFINSGFKIEKLTYKLTPFKNNWLQYKNGNGFYILKGIS